MTVSVEVRSLIVVLFSYQVNLMYGLASHNLHRVNDRGLCERGVDMQRGLACYANYALGC